MMLNTFDQMFTDAMKDRAEQMNLSLYEVLKIAALIEREAVKDDERPLIADVYLKRYAEDGWKLDFFFQAEDGIRDKLVTGVQTCALPILPSGASSSSAENRSSTLLRTPC